MNKTLKKIMILLLVLISISYTRVSASEENIPITINSSQTQIAEGDKVNIKINVESEVNPTSVVIMELYYSKKVFEELVDDDFEKIGRWNYPEIALIEDNQENEDEIYYYRVLIDRNADISNVGTILSFGLKVRDEVENFENACIGVSFIEMSNKDATSIEREEKNIVYKFINNKKLYLDSNLYHIGNDNQTTYDIGDKYITRINPNTTRTQFLDNIYTNGDVTLYNVDGTEQIDSDENDNEIMKTGMTIKVRKEGDEDINLTLVVMGDIDKSGNVTATDLATFKQGIQKEIELQGAPYKAADISEDNQLSATDLAAMIQLILQELVI